MVDFCSSLVGRFDDYDIDCKLSGNKSCDGKSNKKFEKRISALNMEYSKVILIVGGTAVIGIQNKINESEKSDYKPDLLI